jgi:molybdopterin synthase sulfur carrier subunit
MPTLKIPPVLRASTAGEREVEGAGSNIGEVLRDLADKHPATQSQLFGEGGELNRYVNVYLNDEDVRFLGGLETPVKDGDTVTVLPAVAGGARGVRRAG